MKTTTLYILGRVSIAMLLLAVVLSCNGKQPDPYPPAVIDTVETVEAPSEDDLPDDAQLMHEMWSLLRADADTTNPTVILADFLADEAHAQELVGAHDDALLFWSEAIRLIEQTRSDSARVIPTPVAP